MHRQYQGSSSTNGTFHTSTRGAHYAQVTASIQQTDPQARRKEAEERERWHAFFHKMETLPRQYKKLISRAAVCLVLAIGILGIKLMDPQVAEQFSGEITSAVNDGQEQQEELGRLQFVNGGSGLSYSLPLEGEVVESFAESERNVSIRSTEQAEVKSILPGTVVKTSVDSVVINNANGTQTTYTGIVPKVLAGDTVESAQIIGVLGEEVLCLETVSGIGYLDSLDVAQLEQATAQIES